ncbi:MAG: DUF3164 family protein [Bacteroidales bacterium]
MEKQVNLNELSPAQKAELMEQLKAEKAAEKQKVKDEREAYKALASDTVDRLMPMLSKLSGNLALEKAHVYSEFEAVLALKKELYGIADGQRSNTFINEKGDWRITIGSHTVDNYLDTVNEGIAMVQECIQGLGTDDNSRALVEVVNKLLSKDAKGNLKPSRVMQLRQLANKQGNARLLEGIEIIEAAYSPIESKKYVRAEYKNEHGAWVTIPLGMTEA